MTAALPTARTRRRPTSATSCCATFRNRRFFLFSLVFPLVLFLLVAGPNRDQTLQGIPFADLLHGRHGRWGTMTAVIAGGARIAAERSIGWNRQLRVSPLRHAHVLRAPSWRRGYSIAVVSIAVLYVAGAAFGVRLSAGALGAR